MKKLARTLGVGLSDTVGLRRWLCRAAAVALTTLACGSSVAVAKSEAAAEGEGEEAAAAGEHEGEVKPFVLDLGFLQVRDWRPTRNETPNLRFGIAVVFGAETSPATRTALKHWKNRLRDQAIIAMRLAETRDFTEPDLHKVQRLIQVRINRILPQVNVESVMLTDFSLDDH